MWDCTPCSEITTSFIWVTTTPCPHLPFAPPPPSPSPSPSSTPKSFCNVIDSILRKCIYFQIKYLFKELLHVSDSLAGCQKGAIWWGDNAAAADEKKKKNRNAEGLDGSFFNTFPPARETTKHKSRKGRRSLADTPNEANAGSTI